MFIGYEQRLVVAAAQTAAVLNIPAGATGAVLQADVQNVRYTMDNATDPTQILGMVLAVGLPAEQFLIEDLMRIRFCRGAAADAMLNIHYWR